MANRPADGLCGGHVGWAGPVQTSGNPLWPRRRNSAERILGLLHNLYLLSALVLYAGFAVLWVWILSFTPLSRAYPFVALAFALTPLLGALLFGEAMSLRHILGIVLVLCGLFLVMS